MVSRAPTGTTRSLFLPQPHSHLAGRGVAKWHCLSCSNWIAFLTHIVRATQCCQNSNRDNINEQMSWFAFESGVI